jgi:hypothetical protein
MTEYVKMRAVNMMKNNQLFQRLGLGQLKILLATGTAKNKEDCHKELESLYDGEDNDGSDEEDVTMVLIIFLVSTHYLLLLLGSQSI